MGLFCHRMISLTILLKNWAAQHIAFDRSRIKSVIIANMIYDFSLGKSPLIIGVRGFIFAGLSRIAPVR